MIKILDSNLIRVGIIKNAISSGRLEEINGENTLDFTAILDAKLNAFIDENTIFELDNEYFDIARFKKDTNEDNTYTLEVESEHVSYRLNDPLLNVEYFTEEGTPTYILGQILDGTDFTIGTIEYEDVITYSAQEAKSRRGLLMEFVAYLGGEISFSNFEISIVVHRGSSVVKSVIKGKNVNVVSKIFNKRQKDTDGNSIVSYSCEPIYLPTDNYTLGDEILLIQTDLNIREQLRVVSLRYNPYNSREVTFQFANYVNGLADRLYHIETSTVVKDKIYNGTRIGPEFGFEAIRSDKKARAYFRSDGMAMQAGDGVGNYANKLYYDYNPETDETILVFDGILSAQVIEAVAATIDIVVSYTIITQNLYASDGRVTKLTVDRLLTGNVLDGDEYIYYIDIHDQYEKFIEAHRRDDLPQIQYTNAEDELLYWADEEHETMGIEITDFPVKVYQYDLLEKMQLCFEMVGAYMVPKIMLGAGDGILEKSGKAEIYKSELGLFINYYKNTTSELRQIKLTNDGIVMTPSFLIFPDTTNDAQVNAESETTLQGIDISFKNTTRVAFDVQIDVTASVAMTVTIKARIAGETHRQTIKYFAGAYKDQVVFNGIFDIVAVGLKTVDFTITPSSGTATIEIGEYRMMLTVRDAEATEAAGWPEANVEDAITSIAAKILDSILVVLPTDIQVESEDTISLILTDDVEVQVT